MNFYELRDGDIYPIECVNQATGSVLRCPGCGCISLKLIDGLVASPLHVDETCALQCCSCGMIYQIVTKLAWPFVQIAKGGP